MDKSVPKANSRFETAKIEKEATIQKLFKGNNLVVDDTHILLRAFKKEKTLELWAKAKSDVRFKRLKTYPFCKLSGQLGPKRKEGDLQVPEGIYYIDRFNEQSKFYLSLGINYPNKSDKILGDPQYPGSDIFIHGKCETIGCIPITDFWIKELFVIAKNASDSGQEKIPVHIFPFKMNENNLAETITLFPKNKVFWNNLSQVFSSFEGKNEIQSFSIDTLGRYQL